MVGRDECEEERFSMRSNANCASFRITSVCPKTVTELMGPNQENNKHVKIFRANARYRDPHSRHTIEVFVFEPMLPLLRSRRRQIGQVANDRLSPRTWRERQGVPFGGQECFQDIKSKNSQDDADESIDGHIGKEGLKIMKSKPGGEDDGGVKREMDR